MLTIVLSVGIPIAAIFVIAVAVITWRTLYNVLDDHADIYEETCYTLATLGAIIWPLSLSLLAGFWIYEAWSKQGRANRLRRKRQKELESERHKTDLAQEVARRERLVTEERVKRLESENRERALLGLPTVTQ